MTTLGLLLAGGGALALLYPYVLYPGLLRVAALLRPAPPLVEAPSVTDWPSISITVPVYNEEAQIRELLETLLRVDYPASKRQILIVSDASTDATDRIVREYADRGVELLRLDERSGKTAAENVARHHLRGDVIVNTDASVRVDPRAVRHMVAALQDPGVGVASARDVSFSGSGGGSNAGESRYVGYEMKIRRLENRVEGIVGASGCLYALRRELHQIDVPRALARDFHAALHARVLGLRSVSVDAALCHVPRTGSLTAEYPRKVRTLTRGMQTLMHKRELLNPLRCATFAWMLLSHKVLRWSAPWAMLLVATGLLLLAPRHPLAGWSLLAVAAAFVMGMLPWLLESSGRGADRLPRAMRLPAYLLVGTAAAAHASLRVLAGRGSPIWEPTRRRDPVTTLPRPAA